MVGCHDSLGYNQQPTRSQKRADLRYPATIQSLMNFRFDAKLHGVA